MNPLASVSSTGARRCGVALLLPFALTVHAQITNVVLFNVGATPFGGLVQATDGNLYGTTVMGGSGYGTIFGVDTNGHEFPMYSFSNGGDGGNPYGSLIQGADGGLYGTTTSTSSGAGYGTVFRMGLDGTFKTLHTFSYSDGATPYGGLVQVRGGLLFGTTVSGGANGLGSVYEMTTNGSFATFFSFDGTNDGVFPYCQLLQASDGYLYGTTAAGDAAANEYGTIFVMDPSSGAFANYYNFTGFSSDGAFPYGVLAQGTDGYIYGTTAGFPPNSAFPAHTVGGTVFKVPPFGTTFAFSLLHTFSGAADGRYPYAGLIEASDGNLYGTTTGLTNNPAQEGTLFAITGTSNFTTLQSFNGGNGANPYDSLVQGLDGNLYGTTSVGGANGGGTVFRYSLGAPPFILRQPASQSPYTLTTVSLSVLAGGTAPLTYRWLRGTTNLSDGGRISGSGTSTLTISGVIASDAGSYSVLVSSLNGEVASAAAQLTVRAIRPTVTVVNPTPNAQVYTPSYTITGRASEALGISNVFYSLDGGGWALASTTNNWTNWSAAVSLLVATNRLQVYAVDPYGNTSVTNSLNLVYVLAAPIVVLTNGLGTVSPITNGELLAIGRTYSMTAIPGPGFTFTNWTGSAMSNSAKLTFLMQSNLSFTANFVDVTRPVAILTAPKLNQSISNADFTLVGKASDNVSVSNVYYQLNGMGWNVATTSDNWSNFTADVTLSPGTNVVQIYATDSTGNSSLTNTVKCFYVVLAPLAVQTNGFGKVSPNYNGSFLEIGRSYSMTATPLPGFAFTNWTGSVVSNGARLAFLMESNLSFTANFVDVTRPTVSVIAPTANMEVSNAVFTVIGKASDNVSVSNVNYQLNGMGWNLATTTNNWTNWTAQLMLTPGINLLQVYSMDSTGNYSLTNTVKFDYVLSGVFIVMTNGFGKVTPNYNGELLAIGRTYTMTATPAIGFAFTNWTGGALSNSAKLTFIMQSNLTFTANFVDVTRPVVTVTAPTLNQMISNADFTLVGKASDNVGVSNVYYQLNGSGWNPATTLNNWSNFTADVTLSPGTNVVQVDATDGTGNLSLTNTVKCFYVVLAPLEVQTNGLGKVTPNYNGNLLEIGRSYTMTATAGAGFAFTNWTGSVSSNSAKLTFLMASNLDLIANFVDITPPKISITSPTVNRVVSNALFTATGTASDNVGVSSVFYQLNGTGWNLASTLNNWSNWTASLSLSVTTNVIQAYSMDAAGNRSSVVSNRFLYRP